MRIAVTCGLCCAVACSAPRPQPRLAAAAPADSSQETAPLPDPAAPLDAEAQTHDVSVYYGTERATLGSWFGNRAIGNIEKPRLPVAAPGVDIRLVTSGRRIDGVDIKIPFDSCAPLQSRLAQLWGPPHGDEGWHAKSGAQGAKLDTSVDLDGSCELHFFRRVSPHQWLDWSRQSVVPLWAIGKPVSKLEAALAVLQPEHEDQQLRWQDTAIDGTHVTLIANVRGKRVVGIRVSTDMRSHATPVWQRLRAMFGPPDSVKMAGDSFVWSWRRTPRIEVSTFVGTLPPLQEGTPPGVEVIAPPPATPPDPGFPLEILFGQ